MVIWTPNSSASAGRAKQPANSRAVDEQAVVTGADAPPSRRIVVLAGGPGPEREVSLESGKMVAQALARLGHRVCVRDIFPDDLSALDEPAELFFVALHGTFGEDGRLQEIMESRNLTYTGSDAKSSALAMDKAATKRCWLANDVPTPEFRVVTRASLGDVEPGGAAGAKERVGEIAEGLGLATPCVIKPVDSGSSVDTFIARDRGEVCEPLRRVVGRYGSAMVERYVDGPELTVGLLDGVALPVCEIQTDRTFYDYVAKYQDDATRYLFEIDLPKQLLASVQGMSVKAASVLGVDQFARVDWMIERETMLPFALEINTIPGFTSHSLLPKSARRVGLSYDWLCQRIVDSALARAAR